jgi:hypothetical protein
MSKRTQITLTDRQYAFLRAEAEESGLSLSELIRRAVDAWFRPHVVGHRRLPRSRKLDERF